MRVYINGESRELSGTPSLAELITQLDLPPTRIAIELNREVVRRNDWSGTLLNEDDRVEIVHFVGGGAE
jgi:thiamine biosynthesis protein ThiS